LREEDISKSEITTNKETRTPLSFNVAFRSTAALRPKRKAAEKKRNVFEKRETQNIGIIFFSIIVYVEFVLLAQTAMQRQVLHPVAGRVSTLAHA